jgi:hypothetical protein
MHAPEENDMLKISCLLAFAGMQKKNVEARDGCGSGSVMTLIKSV